MMDQNKLMKLFELATGEQPKTKQIEDIRQLEAKKKTGKAKNKLAKYRGMYSDPLRAWEKWFREIQGDTSSRNADEIWNMAEQEFPGTPEDAKNWLRNDISAEIDDSDPVIKEQKLRNRMLKSPEWAAKENLGTMDKLGSVVSNQNLTKVRSMYASSLEQKAMQLRLTELDPDVPIEVHVEDMMLLESLNILDGAQVVSGRLAAVNASGQVQPAFAIRESSDIADGLDPSNPELQMVYSVAPKIFEDVISSAISNSQGSLKLANKAASGASINMLKGGNLPIEEWGSAIDLLGDSSGGVSLGLEGLLNKNPAMSQEELLMHSTDAALRYRGPTQ